MGRETRPLLGFLNIDKPAGVTSRDVVNQIQRLVRPTKIGHAGTLDPLATGVLVVGLGAATRLTEYVQRMRKHYTATFRLGARSDTEDRDGTVVEMPSAPQPSREALDTALPALVGDIQQRPPAYSALKVAGQRAYDRARRGETVTLAPRPVRVYSLRITAYAFPLLRLEVECGAGTYVRAIGRDLAESLGTGAIMTELVRTAIGSFRVTDAVPPESLTSDNLPRHLLPPLRALDGCSAVTLDTDQLRRTANGQLLRFPNHGLTGPIAAVDEHGALRAVLCVRDQDHLHPEIVLPHLGAGEVPVVGGGPPR